MNTNQETRLELCDHCWKLWTSGRPDERGDINDRLFSLRLWCAEHGDPISVYPAGTHCESCVNLYVDSPAGWALRQGYEFNDDLDLWFDDGGEVVDIDVRYDAYLETARSE